MSRISSLMMPTGSSAASPSIPGTGGPERSLDLASLGTRDRLGEQDGSTSMSIVGRSKTGHRPMMKHSLNITASGGSPFEELRSDRGTQLIKMARMQIIPGRERRRSWSEKRKRAIVAAAFAPGAIVADVARRAAFFAGQIYRWRQAIRSAAPVVACPKRSSQRSMTEAVMRKMQCPSVQIPMLASPA